MIIVLFPAGAFGSTMEYSLRQFSNELTKVEANVLPDGSMHSYDKEFHPVSVLEFLKNINHNFEIATPVYPGNDYLTPVETLKKLSDLIDPGCKIILIHFTTIAMYERNQLFRYYKISNFLKKIIDNRYKKWNSDYTSVDDMKLYELREALSFNIDQAPTYLDLDNCINSNWLCITPDDILYDYQKTIYKIIDYCGLTIDSDQNLEKFYHNWLAKQQYVIDEFDNINLILQHLDSDSVFSWNKLSIVGEAIVQSRLRAQGIEIACYNLNTFPSNTQDLKKVLIYT